MGEEYLTHKRYRTHNFYDFSDGTSVLSWDTWVEGAPLHSKSLIEEAGLCWKNRSGVCESEARETQDKGFEVQIQT